MFLSNQNPATVLAQATHEKFREKFMTIRCEVYSISLFIRGFFPDYFTGPKDTYRKVQNYSVSLFSLSLFPFLQPYNYLVKSVPQPHSLSRETLFSFVRVGHECVYYVHENVNDEQMDRTATTF